MYSVQKSVFALFALASLTTPVLGNSGYGYGYGNKCRDDALICLFSSYPTHASSYCEKKVTVTSTRTTTTTVRPGTTRLTTKTAPAQTSKTTVLQTTLITATSDTTTLTSFTITDDATTTTDTTTTTTVTSFSEPPPSKKKMMARNDPFDSSIRKYYDGQITSACERFDHHLHTTTTTKTKTSTAPKTTKVSTAKTVTPTTTQTGTSTISTTTTETDTFTSSITTSVTTTDATATSSSTEVATQTCLAQPLQNPGFDEPLLGLPMTGSFDHWETSGTGTLYPLDPATFPNEEQNGMYNLETEYGYGYDSPATARLNCRGPDSQDGPQSAATLTQYITTCPGVTYDVSFYYQDLNYHDNHYIVIFADDQEILNIAGGFDGPDSIGNPKYTWSNVQTTYPIVATSTTVKFVATFVCGYQGDGDWFFDQVSIVARET